MKTTTTEPVPATPATLVRETLYGRVLAALALAAQTVEDLADAIDRGEGWDRKKDGEDWRRDCHRGDLEGILYTLSVARAQVAGEAPGRVSIDDAEAAGLANVPAGWRRRFEAIPGAAAYLTLLDKAAALADAIDAALEASAAGVWPGGADDDVRLELEDCLRASRRTLSLVRGDLHSSVPAVVEVVFDTRGCDRSPHLRLCSCEVCTGAPDGEDEAVRTATDGEGIRPDVCV